MAWAGAFVALAGFAVLPVVWVRTPPAVIAGYLLILGMWGTFVPIGLMGDSTPSRLKRD